MIPGQFLFGGGGRFYPYEIPQSVLFDGGAWLSRTQKQGDQRTYTLSWWMKRGAFGTSHMLFSAGPADINHRTIVYLTTADQLRILDQADGVVNGSVIWSYLFRDPTAWYHCVLAVDLTQAVAHARHKLYVNGVIQNVRAESSPDAQDTSQRFNGAEPMYIGRASYSAVDFLHAHMAETILVDGQALGPEHFGQFKSGVWVPKRYTGTYGTNGFRLDFANSASYGTDVSGNGNSFDGGGFNSGVTSQVADTPTNNFPVLTLLDKSLSSGAVIQRGGTRCAFANSTTQLHGLRAPWFATSGKWYFEATIRSALGAHHAGIGVCAGGTDASNISRHAQYYYEGQITSTEGTSPSGPAFGNGDTVGVLLDLDAGTVSFRKNGVDVGAPITLDTSVPWGFRIYGYGPTVDVNYGQRAWAHEPPKGFKALCAKNLPRPEVMDARKGFHAEAYAGAGAPLDISGMGFGPDLTWIKSRTLSASHYLFDKVRGPLKRLVTNGTNGELAVANSLTSFNADGFTVGDTTPTGASGATYASWSWKLGRKYGFAIIRYTGDGLAGRKIAHGLGRRPALIITKALNVPDKAWGVYHAALGATKVLALNLQNAAATSAAYWNNTEPTAADFTVGTADVANQAGVEYIAYVWAEIPGFSRFGSYTGSGNANGPFIHLGFRPAMALLKKANGTGNWFIRDTARDPINPADRALYPNLSDAEVATANPIDYLASGLKLRTATPGVNAAGETIIFAAWAEAPFPFANAR